MVLWLTLACCITSLSDVPSAPSTTTVFIVRHAEKDSEGELNQAGVQRSKELSRFLANQNISAVYSTNYARTLDTAKQTAAAAGHQVQTYSPRTTNEWFQKLKRRHVGQNILIVGHSNTVVPLVNGFGAKMKHPIGESDYHNLFIVALKNGTAQAVRINYGAIPAITSKTNAVDTKQPEAIDK